MKQIFIAVLITLVVALGTSCSTNLSKNAIPSAVSASPRVTPKQMESLPTDSGSKFKSDCYSFDVHYIQSKVDPNSLPDYQVIETKCFTFSVPKDWKVEVGDMGPVKIYKNGKSIGEMEVYSYFDADTWISKGFKPNHSDQLEFKEITPPKIEGLVLYAYQSKLKIDPPKNTDETYKYETAALVAIKELDKSFALFVESDFIPDKMVQTIVSSVRLK
jgi:hypothetical protein